MRSPPMSRFEADSIKGRIIMKTRTSRELIHQRALRILTGEAA